MTAHHTIDVEYGTIGPVSATASEDGKYVAIDFPHIEDTSKALRLVFPADQLENFQSALLTVQKALEDPLSGIHYQERH